MAREIKFRAWDRINKIMTYNPINAINFEGQILLNDGKFYDIDKTDYILMQYTGLKDKNGKEIYEGDIIRIKPNPKNYAGYKGHNYIEYVFWNDEEACFDIANDRTWLLLKSDIEIIGNIYENPELIGGGNG